MNYHIKNLIVLILGICFLPLAADAHLERPDLCVTIRTATNKSCKDEYYDLWYRQGAVDEPANARLNDVEVCNRISQTTYETCVHETN